MLQKDIKNNQYIFMYNYTPMFQTSLKMFNSSKVLGKGPKSYRFHCNDLDYISYFPSRKKTVDNTILKINFNSDIKNTIKVRKIFISKNDFIKKNDQLFSYNFLGSNEIFIYKSDKEGVVKEIFIKDLYDRNDIFLKIDPLNSPDKLISKRSACNTHPHNFYFQLLAEVGFIGFIFVFSLFLYISFVLIKNFVLVIKNIPNKKIITLSDAYKEIFKNDNLTENLSNLSNEFKNNKLVAEVIEFIEMDKKRPICTPFSK